MTDELKLDLENENDPRRVAIEALQRLLAAAAEKGHPELLDFTPEDDGVTVTVQPPGLDHPVTTHLRVLSVALIPRRSRPGRPV